MIEVRPVLTEEDIDTYIAVRNQVHPQTPMPREVVVDDRQQPDHLDLIAERDGEPVGAASTEKFGGAPDSDLAFLSMRVIREHRHVGVGTALYHRASEHARELGKNAFRVMARVDDKDSLAYYGAHGFEERGRMQDLSLDLASTGIRPVVPDGIEIVPLSEEYERGAYEVALEADADIPTAGPIMTGSFDRWSTRHLGALLIRELSFVALEEQRVVGYALLGRDGDDTAGHWMTGVARAARGRGVALGLKQAQIAAAKEAGWRFLRTQNDLGNAPMRRVNEKLGYELKFEWVHLVGPLI